MCNGLLQNVMAILTVATLLLQSVTSLSAACQCGGQDPCAKVSCCQAEAALGACCSRPKSRCSSGKRCCGATNTTSNCGCDCSDLNRPPPFVPMENSGRSQTDVELLLHESHLAACAIIPRQQWRVVALPPQFRSASYSMQANLCIWQT